MMSKTILRYGCNALTKGQSYKFLGISCNALHTVVNLVTKEILQVVQPIKTFVLFQ